MVKDSLYCGGPFVKPSELFWPRGSSSDGIDSWAQLEGRTVIGTYRGRTAVALACRLLGLGKGDEILIPSYHCGTELDALLHAGVTPVAYRINLRCEIDLDDLISRKTDRTRAVYLIHYFGWEQPMESLRRWCDEQGLLLIEDCALALFSTGQTGAIGRTGDAAIYSLPKSLGLLRGGLLSLSARPANGPPVLHPAETATWLREILHSGRTSLLRALEKPGLFGALLAMRRHFRSRRENAEHGNGLPDMPGSYYFKPEDDADRELHPRVASGVATVVPENVIRARRANYSRLAAALDGISGLDRLFPDLPPGVCPLALPLLVSNRDSSASLLQARGIAAFPWWAGFHRFDLDWPRFPEACWLKGNILTLPVDQDLDDRHIDGLAAIVADSLRSQ